VGASHQGRWKKHFPASPSELSGLKADAEDRTIIAALKCVRENSVVPPSAAKADTENTPVIAAVNRCGTQNQVQHRVFSQL